MDQLLVRQELNTSITKEQFLEDINCLFETLNTSYGLYEYYGDERFQKAKNDICQKLRDTEFEFNKAVSLLKDELYSFIQDGHFTIGRRTPEPDEPSYDYAIRYSTLHGIDVIECKKFWYDTKEEREQLDQFVANAVKYRTDDPLIIDLRDNAGGSDTFIWEFIKGLFGVEVGFPMKFIQKNSQLFKDYCRIEMPDWEYEFGPELEIHEEDAAILETSKKIYVLFNENTCSAGESAIAFLKSISGTTLVGTHTGGCFVCGNCIWVNLPNSHIPVRFGTGMCLYEKTRNMDAEGGFKGDISYEEFTRLVTDHDPARSN